MGNNISIKPIGSMPDVRKLAAETNGAFDASLNEIGVWAKRKFDDITNGWKHKPDFVIRRTPYTVSVTVAGPNAKIWRFVNDGTPPHLIRAKGGGRRRGANLLTFKTGYQAKTRPNNTVFKGPGVATGGFVSKKVVHHPGSKPRAFERIVTNQAITEGRKILRANFQRRRLPL